MPTSGTSPRPTFMSLDGNYPRSWPRTRENLFNEIGWGKLYNDPAYQNTCALRMSLALLGARVTFPGRMQLRGGGYEGKWVEPGQAKLSQALVKMWGKPEVYKSEVAARNGIGSRKGVISFFEIHPDHPSGQGHIDLVSPDTGGFAGVSCRMSCYFGSREIWFWELN